MLLSFFYLNFLFKAGDKKEDLHGLLNSTNETNHVYKAFIS